jgi:hypothetical protein
MASIRDELRGLLWTSGPLSAAEIIGILDRIVETNAFTWDGDASKPNDFTVVWSDGVKKYAALEPPVVGPLDYRETAKSHILFAMRVDGYPHFRIEDISYLTGFDLSDVRILVEDLVSTRRLLTQDSPEGVAYVLNPELYTGVSLITGSPAQSHPFPSITS